MSRLCVIALLLSLCFAASSVEQVLARETSRQLGYSSGSSSSTSSTAIKPNPSYGSSPGYGASPSSNPSSGSSPGYGTSPSSNPSSGSSPSSGGGPSSNPPSSSSPIVTIPTTGSPVTSSPSIPSSSSPHGKTGKGTCKYWRSKSRNWPKILSRVSKLSNVFGRSCLSRYGGKLTLMDALQTTNNDGFSALARQGAASLLNAYSAPGFELTPAQVKQQFNAAIASPEAADAQAATFEQANESV